MKKIIKIQPFTTGDHLQELIKGTSSKLTTVRVTFENGLVKIISKKDFASHYHGVQCEAEIGTVTGKGKNAKFKSVGWKKSLPEPKQSDDEKETVEEPENKNQYPEPDTAAYKVWKIADRMTHLNLDGGHKLVYATQDIVVTAAQGISIKKAIARVQYNRWKKYRLATDKKLNKPKKKKAKVMANKKTAKKKTVKKKTAAKRGRGRPPGKAKKKAPAKKKVSKKTENPVVKKAAGKRRGRPAKNSTEPRKLATKLKGSDHYYQPSSNTSIV